MGFLSSIKKGVKKSVKKITSSASSLSGVLSAVNPLLGAGAGSMLGLFADDPSVQAQYDINDQNIALQQAMNLQNQKNWQKSFNYMKEQNELTQQREDTAIQRSVTDALNAGLSPLSALGGGASSAVVSSTPSAPQMLAPQLQAPVFQSDLQAQQALLNFASNAILQDNQLSSAEKITAMNNESRRADLLTSLASAEKIAKMSNDTQFITCCRQVTEMARSNRAKEQQAKLDYLRTTVDRITDGKGRFSYGHSAQECKDHNDEIASRYADFVNSLGFDSTSSSSASSSSTNLGLGIAGIGANGGHGSSLSDSSSYSQTSKIQESLRAFWLRSENTLWFE